MTVQQLIEQLEKLPKEKRIMLYYDGCPRLVPNMAYFDTEEGCFAIGEYGDIYTVEPDAENVYFCLKEMK